MVGNKGPKKKQQLQSTLFSDGDEILKGLNKAHEGKGLRIFYLLPSEKIGNYVNKKGRIDVLQFFTITRKSFPPCGS